MPPPVPSPFWFQTFSLLMLPPLVSITVPPQPMTNGLEAGKSVCARPSFSPSVARLSPAAASTVTLISADAESAAQFDQGDALPGSHAGGLRESVELGDFVGQMSDAGMRV